MYLQNFIYYQNVCRVFGTIYSLCNHCKRLHDANIDSFCNSESYKLLAFD